MAEESVDGGCYCGAIRFRAKGAPKSQAMCYCDTCRRAVGAQSVAWVTFDVVDVLFTTADPARFRTDTGAWRTFCAQCGSSLTYESDERPGDIDITTGSLDRPQDYGPTKGVFVDERLPWDRTDLG
jgi:hypothetical protein